MKKAWSEIKENFEEKKSRVFSLCVVFYCVQFMYSQCLFNRKKENIRTKIILKKYPKSQLKLSVSSTQRITNHEFHLNSPSKEKKSRTQFEICYTGENDEDDGKKSPADSVRLFECIKKPVKRFRGSF